MSFHDTLCHVISGPAEDLRGNARLNKKRFDRSQSEIEGSRRNAGQNEERNHGIEKVIAVFLILLFLLLLLLFLLFMDLSNCFTGH